MQPPNLPLVQSYQPTTFLERGVAVPFTTPLLAGTRARPAVRGSVELIVPNPAGGRGVYILAWEHVRDLCRPTVHDMLLNRRIAALNSVTPAAIRTAARAVAADGLAGEAALAAAATAAAADREARLLTNFLLLITLIEQVDPRGIDLRAPGTDIELRARQAVAVIAPRLARKPEDVALALEQLADVLQGVGVPGQTPPARIPRLLALLRRMRAEVGEWGRERAEVDGAAFARMVCAVADLTLLIADRTMNEAIGLTADMPGLLQNWALAPLDVAQIANRPEWLLDGWEQICLLWWSVTAEHPAHAVLAEMTQLVPILPREAAEWIGEPIDLDKLNRFRRMVPLNEDWRTGVTAFNLIARNESLRALMA
jgi:hypothetical protein